MTRPVDAFDLSVAASELELTCGQVLAVIQCYVDCECDVDLMMVLASHLERCDACHRELLTLRWLKAAVRRCSGAPESRSWL